MMNSTELDRFFFAVHVHIRGWTALRLKSVRHSSRVCTSQDLSSTSAGLLGACGCCKHDGVRERLEGGIPPKRPAKKSPDFGSKINIDQLVQPGRCSNQQASPASEQLGPSRHSRPRDMYYENSTNNSQSLAQFGATQASNMSLK